MNKTTMTAILLVASAASVMADVRVNVRLGGGHPLARPGRTVIVRQRPAVVVRERVAWAPPVVWTRRVVVAPPRERLVWEDAEVMRRNEDWVDSTLSVNNRGNEIFLRITGRAQVDFAEVHFHNGQAQVVDFRNNVTMDAGTYGLLDFRDGRQVDYVRIVARARTPEARVAVLMGK